MWASKDKADLYLRARGRAITPAQKDEILDSIRKAWELVPEQRLGQLIKNALPRFEERLALIEDYQLSLIIFDYAKESAGKDREELQCP